MRILVEEEELGEEEWRVIGFLWLILIAQVGGIGNLKEKEAHAYLR